LGGSPISGIGMGRHEGQMETERVGRIFRKASEPISVSGVLVQYGEIYVSAGTATSLQKIEGLVDESLGFKTAEDATQFHVEGIACGWVGSVQLRGYYGQ
jgi:hypothetical protein